MGSNSFQTPSVAHRSLGTGQGVGEAGAAQRALRLQLYSQSKPMAVWSRKLQLFGGYIHMYIYIYVYVLHMYIYIYMCYIYVYICVCYIYVWMDGWMYVYIYEIRGPNTGHKR